MHVGTWMLSTGKDVVSRSHDTLRTGRRSHDTLWTGRRLNDTLGLHGAGDLQESGSICTKDVVALATVLLGSLCRRAALTQ